jgi:DNA-binding transcriptional LysR family regulator
MFDDFKALRAFRAVIETGTLTKAARRLGVTQPAVSRLVFSLERQTGIKLFRRERQRLHPTDEARIFYRDVVRVLSDWERLPQVTAEIRKRSGTHLRLATIPKLGTGFLPPILAEHSKLFPTSQLSVQVCPHLELEKQVLAEHCELGFTRIPVVSPILSQIPLFSLPIVLVTGPNHRLAKRKCVNIEDLLDESFVTQPRGQYMRELLESMFRKVGEEPKVQTESRSSTFAARIASKGVGICLVDAVTARWTGDADCSIIALEETVNVQFCITHLTDRVLSEVAENFIVSIVRVVPQTLKAVGQPYHIYPYHAASTSPPAFMAS